MMTSIEVGSNRNLLSPCDVHRYYCMAIEKSLCDNDLFGIDRHRIVEDPSIMGLAEELKSTVGDYLDEEAAIDDRLLLDEITLAKNAMVYLHFMCYPARYEFTSFIDIYRTLPPTLNRICYRLQVLDIVHATSRNSCCFTKNYGRYMKGTGSVLATCSRAEIDAAYGAEDGDRIARIRGELEGLCLALITLDSLFSIHSSLRDVFLCCSAESATVQSS